jgi:hypothetical protein
LQVTTLHQLLGHLLGGSLPRFRIVAQEPFQSLEDPVRTGAQLDVTAGHLITPFEEFVL